MIGIYDIFRGGEKIGKAEILREGLYYRFRCYCRVSGEVIYRLNISWGDQTENLGVLVPAGDAFYLEKRLPASRFTGQAIVIRAVPANVSRQELFAPVYPDEPFRYLSKLNKARMEQRDGVIGVVFREDQ